MQELDERLRQDFGQYGAQNVEQALRLVQRQRAGRVLKFLSRFSARRGQR